MSAAQPISDAELLTELETIFQMQEQGLTKIETGLQRSETAQGILENRIVDLESSFSDYETAAEVRITELEVTNRHLKNQVTVCTYGLIATVVISAVAVLVALLGG